MLPKRSTQARSIQGTNFPDMILNPSSHIRCSPSCCCSHNPSFQSPSCHILPSYLHMHYIHCSRIFLPCLYVPASGFLSLHRPSSHPSIHGLLLDASSPCNNPL